MEISVNGVVKCVGGIGDFGVLTAIVGWVRRRREQMDEKARKIPGFDEEEFFKSRIDVRFGGLDSSTNRHVHWLTQKLEAGDVVTIRILPDGPFDEPTEKSPQF